MNKLHLLGAVCSFCILSFNVNASTIFSGISGLENIEWMELTATENMTRSSVESQLTSGGAFQGWRYATRSEVETLHDGLWGGTAEEWDVSNYAGARLYFDSFGVGSSYASQNNNGYSTGGYTYWTTYFGTVGACDIATSYSCYGHVAIEDTNFGASTNSGFFSDALGLSTGIDLVNYQISTNSEAAILNHASYLVRTAAVPIPAAIWLFGSGLLGLVGMARRKKTA